MISATSFDNRILENEGLSSSGKYVAVIDYTITKYHKTEL